MKWFSKILTLLGVGVVCTACYGVDNVRFRRIEISGDITAENGEPIAGIRVTSPSSSNMQESLSYIDGHFSIDIETEGRDIVQLEFEDIDGANNGGDFATKTIVVSVEDKESQEVVMYPRQ